MKISQFTVGASRTINLGNFESLRVEASATFEVDVHGPLENQQREAAQEELRKLMTDTYNNLHQKKTEMKA